MKIKQAFKSVAAKVMAVTCKRLGIISFLAFIIYFIAENQYFGWNKVSQSRAETIADFVGIFIMTVAIAANLIALRQFFQANKNPQFRTAWLMLWTACFTALSVSDHNWFSGLVVTVYGWSLVLGMLSRYSAVKAVHTLPKNLNPNFSQATDFIFYAAVLTMNAVSGHVFWALPWLVLALVDTLARYSAVPAATQVQQPSSP